MEKIRVLFVLVQALQTEKDLAVRTAIVDALLGMKSWAEEQAEAAALRDGPASRGPEGQRPGAIPGDDELPAWRRQPRR